MTGGELGMATAVVRRSCSWCGTGLQRRERRPGPHPARIGVCCRACSHWNYIPVSWRPASRLPRWIKKAGNREAVLRAVARLEARVAG